MSAQRGGRDSGGSSRRTWFEGEQPRLRFESVVDADVNERLPADARHWGKGAGSRRSDAPWREVDAGTGAPEFVCPECWSEMAARVRGRSGVEVRVLDERPGWARCAACDPERVC